MTHAEFRSKASEHLTCRYVPGEKCAQKMADFLSRCSYQVGDYASRDSFLDLFELVRSTTGGGRVNTVFYLAIPPSVFLDTARSLADCGATGCGLGPHVKVVDPKAFCKDRVLPDSRPGTGRGDHRGRRYCNSMNYGKDRLIQGLHAVRDDLRAPLEPGSTSVQHPDFLDEAHRSGRSRAPFPTSSGIIRDVQ